MEIPFPTGHRPRVVETLRGQLQRQQTLMSCAAQAYQVHVLSLCPSLEMLVLSPDTFETQTSSCTGP